MKLTLTMVTQKEFRFMVNSLVAQIAPMVEADYGVDYIEAANRIYNSEMYHKLENPATGLYYQSPGYVYSFYKS